MSKESVKYALIRLLEISRHIEGCFLSGMRPEIDKGGEKASGEGAWFSEKTLYGTMNRLSIMNFCYINQQQRLISKILVQARLSFILFVSQFKAFSYYHANYQVRNDERKPH